jgi:hypothetical protein
VISSGRVEAYLVCMIGAYLPVSELHACVLASLLKLRSSASLKYLPLPGFCVDRHHRKHTTCTTAEGIAVSAHFDPATDTSTASQVRMHKYAWPCVLI